MVAPSVAQGKVIPLGAAAARQHSTAFLTKATALNLALLILNAEHQQQRPSVVAFDHLWDSSSLRVCADGAANRLHDSLSASARGKMLPDMIGGDLDSIRPEVADFYSSAGVELAREGEQDSNDFGKCLRWIEQHEGARSSELSVVALGAFGGRLDQQMANLNMAYTHSAFADFYLLSEHSIAFVLQPGSHVIEPNPEAEDGTCGLVPLGGRCEGVRTSGLRWDLDGERPLEFGSLISSSNELVAPRITIETQSPLLWTAGIARSCGEAGGWRKSADS